MSKEKLKTVFLAMLFVLSVLLTQRLWIIIPSGETAGKVVDASGEEELNIYAEILSPQSYVYNFGGGYHTVLFTESDGIWQEAMGLVDAFSAEAFTHEALSLAEWQEINEYKSIKFRFSFPIPLELFYRDFEAWPISEELRAVDHLVVPATETGVLYVADKSRGLYFRLKGVSFETSVGEKIDAVARKGYTDYFRAADVLGIDSDLLLPINFEEGMAAVSVSPEIDAGDQAQVGALAGRFFGETFDFVKRIEENDGSIVYISNYGEKVMKIHADGLLEYTERLQRQDQPESLSRPEALNRVVSFVKAHGGWPSGACLSGFEAIEKAGVPGYRLSFTYTLKGYPVLTAAAEDHAAIVVEIYGGSVGNYRRRIVRSRMETLSGGQADAGEVLVPQKVIDRNLKEIAAAYILDSGLDVAEISKDQLLFDLLSAIDNIQRAYYLDPSLGSERLSPVWKMQIGQRKYCFHVGDGRILYRSQAE